MLLSYAGFLLLRIRTRQSLLPQGEGEEGKTKNADLKRNRVFCFLLTLREHV